MSTQKYDRFKSAPWFQEGVKPPVLIGGAGGIGSWLTILLNRAGFETFVYDFDTLEAVNMAGQLFMHSDIGKPKVQALESITRALCQDSILGYNEKVTAETMTHDIVFTAFDNIEARNFMFQAWKKANTGNAKAIFIDGRLTAEQLTILCVKGDNLKAIEEYERDFIFPDSDVEEVDCTMKQTSHGAAMIAAQMVIFFTNWYAGVLGKDTSRSVPFFKEYFASIDYTNSYEAGIERTELQASGEHLNNSEEEELLGETEETDLTEEEVVELNKELDSLSSKKEDDLPF